MGRLLPSLLLLSLLCATSGEAQTLTVETTDGRRLLTYGGRPLLELGAPWIATQDYRSIYRLSASDSAAGQAVSTPNTTPHGRFAETITTSGNSVTIRYQFDIAENPQAVHLQWYWRLEAQDWNGVLAEATGASAGETVQPIEGLRVAGLKQMDFVLHDVDLSVTCRAADGEWSFQDARTADWAKCYRLEYNRPVSLNDQRSGWMEVTISAVAAKNPIVPLTSGPSINAERIDFRQGPVLDRLDRKLSHIAMLHTVDAAAAPGVTAGEVTVRFADGEKQVIPLRAEREFTSPEDDPRSVSNGRLAKITEGRRAWISIWRNPRPGIEITAIQSFSRAAGWQLIAASGIDLSADQRRVSAVLRGDGSPLPEETRETLDGTWRFAADRVEERDIPVPAFWDAQNVVRDLHQGTYRRNFDVPEAFVGRRIAIRFDAVGDAAEVWVNGRMAGAAVSPALPFEVDITGLVQIPSRDNRLEVRVKDDTHFAVPRNEVAWRNNRHWIPRGMGTNNRKGLYQSVSLVARPVVRVNDVRIQTSVRNREMSATYTLQNTGKSAVRAQVAASVRADSGGRPVLELPGATIDLPGYSTREITVKGPFSGVELWQPDHPTLYTLRTILSDGAQRMQRVDTRFGFREVWFDGPNFYLNGIRCNLRGESPAYSEKVDLMSSREAATEMVRRYQQTNFNVLRFHSMPAPPHVLDVCDEMGMLVIDESAIYASWGMLMPEHPEFLANCREHLRKWVRRDRNHPSVILWSGDNEGLNVNMLTPDQLAEFRRTIDEEDGSRPVIFDGDGTGMGASPASVKHYVSTIADLQDRGGRASGYARDLRNDIYWATAYAQDIPLGCGEFLFPHEPGMREKEREACYMMGLQTRGYRLANWFDIRPYNPSYTGFLRPEGVRKGYEEAYQIIVKSFAPVAVFDKAYDALGPYPAPPVLPVGQAAARELIVYNDTFADEKVQIEWSVQQGGKRIAGEKLDRVIPLGEHLVIPIRFTPPLAGELKLELVSRKTGKETFRDSRSFIAK